MKTTSPLPSSNAQNARKAGAHTPESSDQGPSPEELASARHWERVQARLRAELGEDVYSSWFSSAMIERSSQEQIVLSVATRFLKHWIEHNFGDRLKELWSIEADRPLAISILVRTGVKRPVASFGARLSGDTSTSKSVAAKSTSFSASQASSRAAGGAGRPALGQTSGQSSSDKTVNEGSGQGQSRGQNRGPSLSVRGVTGTVGVPDPAAATGTTLDPRYTFNAFAVGESNQFAYRAAKELARERSVLGCKVLFVRGGVGLGKTHLCQAVAAELQHNGQRTLYLTAEKFMRDFVISLRSRAAVDYKEALSAIDVLVVDDIQFLSGQTIQGEFCHVINTLIDAGKTLVVAADRAPASLDSIDVRMQSRLSSGLVVEIATMDRSVRRAILERRRAAYKAEGGQADVSDGVLDKVADLVTTNGRDLDGAFNRIIAEIGLNNAPVSEQTVAGCIGFLLSNTEQPRVKIEDIQRATALQFGLTKTDLLSQRRTKQIVGPRQIAMYLSKVMTVRSLPDIGRRFGGRDHTTVLHAVRKIEKELQKDASLQKTIEALKSAILSQS